MKTLRTSGVTLIELVTFVSIIVIGVSLVMPSWEQVRNKRNLTGAAEQLTAFVSDMQAVAIKKNEFLTVSLFNGGATNWCMGAVVGNAACDCRITDIGDPAYCAIDGAPRILGQADFELTQMPSHSADTAFTFEPVRGLMVNADLGSPHFFNLVSDNGDFGLQVNVLPTGRIRTCNFDVGKQVPGYENCPL